MPPARDIERMAGATSWDALRSFAPVVVGNERLADGALVEPVPVESARAMGAEFVIAVDVGYRPYEERADGVMQLGFQALNILRNTLGEAQAREADVAIRLDVHESLVRCGPMSLVAVGRDAARHAGNRARATRACTALSPPLIDESRVATQNRAMRIHGSCHCGNLTFDLTWEPDPAEITARACGCSFCTRHGGVWTSNPRGSLTIRMGNARAVTAYTFGTHTASFHICTRCGVPVVVTSEIAGRTYAVVNVNTFDNVDPTMLRRTPASFDGEEEGARLARRQRNWIADVRIEA